MSSCELNEETFNSLVKKMKERVDQLPFMEDESKISAFIDVLPEIAALVYLSQEKENVKELSDTFITQICSVVFNFKTKPYDALMPSIIETENSVTTNLPILEFFQRMHSLVQKQDFILGSISGNIACASLMKNVMLHIFQKKRFDVEPLKILSLFCAMSGLDIPLLITADSCCNSIFKHNEKKPSLNILALNYLLEGCSICSLYFNLTSVPDGYLAPRDWLEGLITVLLDVNYGKNKNIWLRCFRALLKMSVSVVESNLTAIINSAILKITVDDVISKEEYSNLFIELISLYSRLNQLPKFFVKLLLGLTETMKENLLGPCIAKGQVYPLILKATAFCFQQLPFGQITELWKIFSETYLTFVNMSQVFPKGKGAVLFLTQFFSSFLLHANIFHATVPSIIYDKFESLILHTNKELKKNMHVLFDGGKEVILHQQSFLMLCFALGEVKLAYNDCSEKPMNNDLIMRFSHNIYDCTLLLKFLSEEHTNVFYSMLKGDNKALSFLVFQLLIQKIRGLLRKRELTEDESTNLQNSLSCIIEHAKENIIYNASWNTDICTLNASNYGSAIWRVYLKHLPLFLNYIDLKGLLMICGCFHDIVLKEQCSINESEINLKTNVLSILQSIYFQESKYFQVALVASIWKFDSSIFLKKRSCDEMETEENFLNILVQLCVFRKKWRKYLESTPKCEQDKTLNSLWSHVENTCSSLNQILQSKSIIRPKLEIENFNVLQLIDCLPVEYLLPGNQVRCVVGLSVLLFLTPESCNQDDALMIAEKICKFMVAIFDGPRSNWFFDFVNGVAYMRELVNTFKKLVNMTRIDEASKWIKPLFQTVINCVTRNRETLIVAEEYISELKNEREISEISSLVLLTMIEQMSQILKRKRFNPEFKRRTEQLALLLCSLCVKYLKQTEKKHSDFTYSVLIQCYTEVINILTLPACSFDEKKKQKCLKCLPKIIKIAQQNLANTNDNDACFKFFASVCSCYKDISQFMPENFFSIIWDYIYTLIQQQCLITKAAVLRNKTFVEHQISLKKDEIDLLQSLFTLMPQQNINAIVETLIQQMENADLVVIDVFTFQMNLSIIQQIIDSDSKKSESSLSAPILINLLSQLCVIALNQASDSDFNISMISIPILQFISFLLKLRKCCIPRHNLAHCLQICDAAKLQKATHNLPFFLKYFNAVENVVFNLLINHLKIALSSRDSLLYVVIILLKSFMKVGSQDVVSAQDTNVRLQIFQAAKSITRLIGLMAKHKGFAELVPSLIAEYVNCVQNITLEQNVKDNLISGINQLLSLCNERSRTVIALNLNHSCRDVFSSIVKNYNQLKYRGDA
ncbi:unhealthy ribosome biogenesis protein 2-like protein [Trichonephila clavipes]|nr:unhealthy ribosome biogenesis protein 2-like protein [Trichonephila clavipes]